MSPKNDYFSKIYRTKFDMEKKLNKQNLTQKRLKKYYII